MIDVSVWFDTQWNICEITTNGMDEDEEKKRDIYSLIELELRSRSRTHILCVWHLEYDGSQQHLDGEFLIVHQSHPHFKPMALCEQLSIHTNNFTE